MKILNPVKTKFWIPLAAVFAGFLPPALAFAHENYVLPEPVIAAGMRDYSLSVLDALKDPGNLKIALVVSIISAAVLILYFLFQPSKAGVWLDEHLQKFHRFGELVLRLALAASFLFSAHSFAYLGPEISINSLPFGGLIRVLLYVTGALLVLGLFGQAVGLISLALIIAATFVYKDYILTYFNYYGEFLALIFFGSGWFSLDKLIFGANKLKHKFKDWEIFIIRVTYGISILYPAISIKLLHPIIILDIVNRYNLTKFHWLFPHDPLLIALGTGLAQVVVGTAIILGFQTRLNTLITFVLMVLSVVFFKEAVWPHYILLALALYLIINNGGKISLDSYIRQRLDLKNGK